MNKADVLSIARQQLSDAICQDQPPICDPLKVSPWIAMSLLQKAIRRGEERLALRAAATLLHVSPERLWRRCGCIAFEDIGVADLDTVASLPGRHCLRRGAGPQTFAVGDRRRVAAQGRHRNGPHCRDATEILQMMRADIPALNRVRAELIGGIDHV